MGENDDRKEFKEKVNVNVYVYSPDIPINRFSVLYIICPKVLEPKPNLSKQGNKPHNHQHSYFYASVISI